MLRYYKAIRPAAGFNVDKAPTSAPITMELFATVRSNGRILDGTRHVINGSRNIEVEVQLKHILGEEAFTGWTLNINIHPRDIVIRKGMLSTVWADISEIVAARNATVFDDKGTGIPHAEFLRRACDEDDVPIPAAFRWGLMLSECGKFVLQLQGLPGVAATLNGKPSFKR